MRELPHEIMGYRIPSLMNRNIVLSIVVSSFVALIQSKRAVLSQGCFFTDTTESLQPSAYIQLNSWIISRYMKTIELFMHV